MTKYSLYTVNIIKHIIKSEFFQELSIDIVKQLIIEANWNTFLKLLKPVTFLYLVVKRVLPKIHIICIC